MKREIERYLSTSKRVTVDLNELERHLKNCERGERRAFFYRELADAILAFAEEGRLTALKSAKPYSRDRRIVERYKKLSIKDEKADLLKEEILTSYHPSISVSAYIHNIGQYQKDKPYLSLLNDYLATNARSALITVNERSYEIFGQEKFLSSSEGRKLLTMTNLTYESLGCYLTYEPFFYYGAVECNQAILIIENKDTFDSFKKIMQQGVTTWGDVTFSMLIYGEGNKITRSFDYLDELNVPAETPIYYFGDLDPEGIAIFHRLKKKTERPVHLMTMFYQLIWERRKNGSVAKDQRKSKEAIQEFLAHFPAAVQKEMEQYIEAGKYVPQEAMNKDVIWKVSNEYKKDV